MLIAVPELIMLGGSTASAYCCVVAPSRAGWRERAQAIAMVFLMGVAVVGTVAWTQYAVAGLVVLLVTLSITRPYMAGDQCVDWHRALGAALMVLFVLLHLHVAEGTNGHDSMHHVSTDHISAVPVHDVLLLYLLQIAAVAHTIWTGVVVVRLRLVAETAWLRWEHGAMALTVLAMAFLMT